MALYTEAFFGFIQYTFCKWSISYKHALYDSEYFNLQLRYVEEKKSE